MRRLITYLLLGFFLLVVTLVVLTQTRYFKNILREQIIAEANKYLNGRFDLEQITGNLITHFEISKVLLTQNADTVFYLPKMKFALSPKRLLKKELSIRVVSVDSLLMQLQQMPDSSWNISHLLQKKETIPTKEQQPVQWKISLHDFKLRQAKVKILPLSKTVGLPSVIDGINSRLSLSYNNASFELILKDFHLQTHQPDFAIESISMQ